MKFLITLCFSLILFSANCQIFNFKYIFDNDSIVCEEQLKTFIQESKGTIIINEYNKTSNTWTILGIPFENGNKTQFVNLTEDETIYGYQEIFTTVKNENVQIYDSLNIQLNSDIQDSLKNVICNRMFNMTYFITHKVQVIKNKYILLNDCYVIHNGNNQQYILYSKNKVVK